MRLRNIGHLKAIFYILRLCRAIVGFTPTTETPSMLEASLLLTHTGKRACSVSKCVGERVIKECDFIGNQLILAFNLVAFSGTAWTMHEDHVPQKLSWPPKQLATEINPSVEYETDVDKERLWCSSYLFDIVVFRYQFHGMTGKVDGQFHIDATVIGPGDDATLMRSDGSGQLFAYQDRCEYINAHPNRPV